jgi:hypothetical protein
MKITTLPDFVRAKFTRFENWESTSSAGWDFKLFIPTCNRIVCAKFISDTTKLASSIV